MARLVLVTVLLTSPLHADDTLRNLSIEHERDVTVTVLTGGGCGTGFVVHKDCDVYVVTAQHVVKDNKEVQILDIPIMPGDHNWGRVFTAEVVRVSEVYDMALLRLNPETSAHFRVGANLSPDRLRVGQRVHHVGAARGVARAESFSEGIVSFVGRIHPRHMRTQMDQVTCAIYPGCSGGPVFDEQGRVVGIALLSAGPQLGLIHPSSLIRKFLLDAD